MRPRTTAILALLFAALAGYLYFVELPRRSDDGTDGAALDFDEATVSSIELEHPGRKVVLQRKDGDWTMVEPVQAPADRRSVENLLSAVEECEIKRTFTAVDDLAKYGLDVPSATIRLRAGDDEIGTIEVGKKTPVGGSAYILRSGDDSVHLTDATFLDRIDQKAADLRDKTILAFDKKSVRTLEVRANRGTVKLERDDDVWSIVAPREYGADASQVASLLSTLESLRATEFVEEEATDLARYGLAAPRGAIVLGLEEGDPLELRIGSEREGKLRVQTNRRPTVYAIASWAGASFDKGVDDFRDKTVARFAAPDAHEIEISGADGGRIGLRRSEDGWHAVTEEAEVEQAAVEELLRELSTLSGFEVAAESPPNLSDFGLDPPLRSLRVHDAGGNLLAAVAIGSHAADGAQSEYSALAEGSTTVFHIRDFVFERINKGQDLLEEPVASEGAAPPVPDGEPGDGVNQEALDDTAAAGEER